MDRSAKAPLHGFVLVIALLFVAGPAMADSPDADPATQAATAEEHSLRGVELYQAGKLPEAVTEMLKAYELAPEAGLLYNIARIYHKMDQTDLAQHYYKEFVKDPGADPDRVAKALAHLGTLEKQAAAAARPAVAPASAPTQAPTVVRASSESSGGGGLQAAAWVTLGVSAATLITGGLLGGLALSAAGDVSDSNASYDDKLHAQDSAKSLALGADVTLGIGAALAATSIILFIVGSGGDDEDSSSATLAPLLGPGSAGAAFTVTFE